MHIVEDIAFLLLLRFVDTFVSTVIATFHIRETMFNNRLPLIGYSNQMYNNIVNLPDAQRQWPLPAGYVDCS